MTVLATRTQKDDAARPSLVADVSSNEEMKSRANIYARCERLTPRERQVLRLIGAGKTTKEIADELRVSARTIDTHRSHIAMKADTKSLAELMQMAILFGSSHRSAGKSGVSLPKTSSGVVRA